MTKVLNYDFLFSWNLDLIKSTFRLFFEKLTHNRHIKNKYVGMHEFLTI